ncbi:MAG: hypothetical protein K8I60_23190 [Anaerolineae bacterium]|nr:hypothetical protein [Anaerolineae bacterium]
MNNISPEALTICGLSVGVVVLILIAALLVLQVLRGSVFGFAMMIVRMLTEPKEEKPTTTISAQAQAQSSGHSLEELRARAKSLDFDSTVEKFRAEDDAKD